MPEKHYFLFIKQAIKKTDKRVKIKQKNEEQQKGNWSE